MHQRLGSRFAAFLRDGLDDVVEVVVDGVTHFPEVTSATLRRNARPLRLYLARQRDDLTDLSWIGRSYLTRDPAGLRVACRKR